MQAAIHLWIKIQSLIIEDESTNTSLKYQSLCVQFQLPIEIIDTLKQFIKRDLHTQRYFLKPHIKSTLKKVNSFFFFKIKF